MSEKLFCVYMMASGKRGTIYTGVTSNLVNRALQHRTHAIKDSFTDRYDVTNLVWFEQHDRAETAILREKQIKNWRRAWKVELIQQTNPSWLDLWEDIIG